MRAIKIDSNLQVITEYENTGLKSLQSAVGGLIATAYHFPNGDTLFVDDEGLLKEPDCFFTVKDSEPTENLLEDEQLFAGNGVIVGAADSDGNDTPAKSTLSEAAKFVTFRNRFEIQEIARALEEKNDGGYLQ